MSEPYAAVKITLLDRESGRKTAYAYPATRVELVNGFAQVERTFTVVADGSWQEEMAG